MVEYLFCKREVPALQIVQHQRNKQTVNRPAAMFECLGGILVVVGDCVDKTKFLELSG